MTISTERLREMLAACEDYIDNYIADFDEAPHAEPVGEFNPYTIRELISELLASRSAGAEGREAVGAIADIAAERRRQVEVEGWTPEHDDKHGRGELVYAAACYALQVRLGFGAEWLRRIIEGLWPWAAEWWKPTTPRRNLVKAGALMAAEIDRLDRRALKENSHGA